METLIFIAIAVIITIIQKKAEKSKERQNRLPPSTERRENAQEASDDGTQEHKPPRSLQDLIRQFENAQQQAEQGNIEPPTPPVERKRRHFSGKLTLRDIAEVVIGVDEINLEFLMDEFEVDENTAAEMLMDLQAHHIVGRDMGEGYCDVLVHDKDELDNLLSHAERYDPQQMQAHEKAEEHRAERLRQEARQREMERQRELMELEKKAKSARESAAAFTAAAVHVAATGAENVTPEASPRRATLVSTRSIGDVRKGFIWAKVLDEPRFKKHWSAQYR